MTEGFPEDDALLMDFVARYDFLVQDNPDTAAAMMWRHLVSAWKSLSKSDQKGIACIYFGINKRELTRLEESFDGRQYMPPVPARRPRSASVNTRAVASLSLRRQITPTIAMPPTSRVTRSSGSVKRKSSNAFDAPTPATSRSTRGGAIANATNEDCHIYSMFLVADSVHDFGISFDESTDDVAAIIGDDHKAQTMLDGLARYTMTMDDLFDEKRFCSAMAAQFPELHGVNMVTEPLASASTPQVESVEDLFNKQQAHLQAVCDRIGKQGQAPQTSMHQCVHVDVWTAIPLHDSGMGSVQRMRLIHLVQLIAATRSLFGSETHEAVLDAGGHALMRVIVNIGEVNTYLMKVFSYSDYKEVGTSTDALHSALRHLAETKRTDVNAGPIWKISVCDANIFDAGGVPVSTQATIKDIDPRPTGPLYWQECCPYQVELLGIHRAPTGPQIDHVKMRLTDNVNLRGATVYENIHTAAETKNAFSINRIFRKKHDGDHALIRARIESSDAMKYALKRAGDWGQVEHCKRYGKLFMTCDRLAALYAVYRDVPVIFLHAQHSSPALTDHIIEGSAEVTPTLQNTILVKYSFIMVN